MQTQNQKQHIAEEEFLLPLSENELASIAGGCPPRPTPPPHFLSNEELDVIQDNLNRQPPTPNPLDLLQARLEREKIRKRPKFN